MNVGLGGGPLGDAALTDDAAVRLVHAAVDLGVTVIDTAPSYGASEARIGRALAARDSAGRVRDRVVLVTKGGYGVPGVPDWTPEVVAAGIDRALARLGTDRIDAFLLHSCAHERLARGDLLAPLEDAKRAGKIGAFGYSGDGDALAWAVECRAFDVIECSVNVVDAHALEHAVPAAHARGATVLAKRAFASAAFAPGGGREGERGEYPRRFREAFSDLPSGDERLAGLAWDEVAVRFAAWAPGVKSALFGTKEAEHLAAIVRFARRGPLPEAVVAELRARLRRAGWNGVV